MVEGPDQYSHWLLHVALFIHSTNIFASNIYLLSASFVPSAAFVVCISADLTA